MKASEPKTPARKPKLPGLVTVRRIPLSVQKAQVLVARHTRHRRRRFADE